MVSVEWPVVGRPAWCHILSEKNVSTRSPNPDVVDSDDSGGETNANKTLAGLGRTTLNLSFGNRSSPERQLGNTLSELELLDTFRDTLRTIFGFIINVEDLSDDENSSGRLSY